VTTGQAGVEGGGLWSGSEFLGGGSHARAVRHRRRDRLLDPREA
jgi:hypothetical protein